MSSCDVTSGVQAPAVQRMGFWWQAMRPKTLLVSFVPVLFAVAWAGRQPQCAWRYAGWALAVAILIQIATNLVNDYADAARGADTPARLGPVRAAAQGLLAPARMRRVAGAFLGCAILCGLPLVWRMGWVGLLLGVLCLLAGVGYTAGPAYAYRGGGELAVFLVYGPLGVGGAAYAMTLQWPVVWLPALASGSLVAAVMMVNNLRDRHTDALALKRTLAVRYGERAMRYAYQALIWMPFAWLGLEAWRLATPAGLLCGAALPAAWGCARAGWCDDAQALNTLLGRTARLACLTAALWCIGVLL